MAHQALPCLYGLGLGLGDGCGLAETFERVSSTHAGRLGQLEACSIMQPQAELGVVLGCRLSRVRVIQGLGTPNIP